MHFRQAILKVEHKNYTLVPGQANSFDEIYADFQNQPENGGERWSVFLHPKRDVQVQRLEVQFSLQLPTDTKFFANGFQSRSESRLLRLSKAIPRLHWFVKKRWGWSGDACIPNIPQGRGYLHSWTYTILHHAQNSANGSEKLLFAGSLNESTGFTIFLYDQPNGILTVRKDMDGLQLSHSFPTLDFWVSEGTSTEIFDRYFHTLRISPLLAKSSLGWTTGQRHPDQISEASVLQHLENVSNSGLPFDCFQVGDGWQSATGDWLSAKKAFPNGMGLLANKIREKGLSPSLWLAPFVATRHSELATKHPDWLLKDSNGAPIKVGQHPMWGGVFHALDFYNNEVRNYLGAIFHQALDKWGFESLQIDCLFAVCIKPPPNKTRGQVMHEALTFLRTISGAKKIIAAGVPLGSAFGLTEYCFIGSDTHRGWENKLPLLLNHRERPSACAALHTALGRWQLSGRAFHTASNTLALTHTNKQHSLFQQQTYLTINALLGRLLFCADDLSAYSPEQTTELEATLDLLGSHILAVKELEKDVYRIDFDKDGAKYAAFCNLTRTTKNHTWSARDNSTGNTQVELMPYETLILTN